MGREERWGGGREEVVREGGRGGRERGRGRREEGRGRGRGGGEGGEGEKGKVEKGWR